MVIVGTTTGVSCDTVRVGTGTGVLVAVGVDAGVDDALSASAGDDKGSWVPATTMSNRYPNLLKLLLHR